MIKFTLIDDLHQIDYQIVVVRDYSSPPKVTYVSFFNDLNIFKFD
jgi:hypothetical protein